MSCLKGAKTWLDLGLEMAQDTPGGKKVPSVVRSHERRQLSVYVHSQGSKALWETEATSQNQVWTLLSHTPLKSVRGGRHGERERRAGEQNGLRRKGGQRREDQRG